MRARPIPGEETIVYNCPACRRSHSVAAKLVGRLARCRNCGHVGPIAAAQSPGPESSEYELAGSPLSAPAPAPGPGPHPPLEPEPIAGSPRAARRGILSKAWHGGAIEESQIQGIALLWIILSAVDLLLTVTLLRTSPRFFEGNPFANWFLARWNVMGLVMFKFGILGTVTVVSEFIERRRPGWGRFVLLVGCVGAAYAIYTGLKLYLGHVIVPVAMVE